jgi:hypothetical protein
VQPNQRDRGDRDDRDHHDRHGPEEPTRSTPGRRALWGRSLKEMSNRIRFDHRRVAPL